MKLVDAEIVFGGGKIIFSFFAEERVDFRALVSDLARVLKMRIELRQIGAREEARVARGAWSVRPAALLHALSRATRNPSPSAWPRSRTSPSTP